MRHNRHLTDIVRRKLDHFVFCPLPVWRGDFSDIHLEWNSEAVRILLRGNFARAGDGSLHGVLHVQVGDGGGGGGL